MIHEGGLWTLVQAYDAGQCTRQEMIEQLAVYPYEQGTYPPGTYDAYIPGSWDELALMVVQDIITDDEFEHILAQVSKKGQK